MEEELWSKNSNECTYTVVDIEREGGESVDKNNINNNMEVTDKCRPPHQSAPELGDPSCRQLLITPLTPNSTILPLHLCASKDPNQATNFTPPLQVHLLAPCKGSQQGGIIAHQCKWVGVVKISRSVQFPDTLFSLYSDEL